MSSMVKYTFNQKDLVYLQRAVWLLQRDINENPTVYVNAADARGWAYYLSWDMMRERATLD